MHLSALAGPRKLFDFISTNAPESSIMSRRRWGGAEAERSFRDRSKIDEA
jgi:hypothetical protein